MAKELNERKVDAWRVLQAIYESRVSFEAQRRQLTLQESLYVQQHGSRTRNAPQWPAFQSALYAGRKMTAAILQTAIGQYASSRVPRITMKLQHLHGKVWAGDDSFKRCMRVRGPAVMDNTLGNEHHQIIGFWTMFSKGTVCAHKR